MKRFRFLFSLVVPVLVMLLAACGNSSAATNTPVPTTTAPSPTPATSSAAEIKTASETVNGKNVTALTSDKGWTLYYFTPDTATASACKDACATTWPPVTSTGTPTSTAGLNNLGLLAGTNQVTYNGHPVYTYSKDTGPGQTNGEGVGGTWHVITTDVAPLTGGSPKPASTPTPAPSNGGGYNY